MKNKQINEKNKIQNKYEVLASVATIDKTRKALEKNNFITHHVITKTEALNKIKEMIPEGVSIMNGSSTTLHEIGYIDLLKSKNHKWINLHDAVLAEKDPQKQDKLRKQSVISDYYLGSAHAVTEKGELVIASNTGSQLPHLVNTSPNIILIVGTQKIVKTLGDAFKRLDNYVIPLEDNRMIKAYGFGTRHSKTLIYHQESPMSGRKIHIIFVDEKLGF